MSPSDFRHTRKMYDSNSFLPNCDLPFFVLEAHTGKKFPCNVARKVPINQELEVIFQIVY